MPSVDALPNRRTHSDGTINIGIASVTRFHLFDLAREMMRRKQRVALFTGCPIFKVDSDLRAVTRRRSRWALLSRARSYLPVPLKSGWMAYRTDTDLGRWLYESVEDCDLDILHAHNGVGLEAGRAMRERRRIWLCDRPSAHILAQKQLVTEEHQRWGVPVPGHYFDPRMLERMTAEYAEATAIVVPSRFAKRSFIEQGVPSDRVHVCPYGVDLSMFHPQPRADKKFRVLFVGNISVRKGIGYVFDAVRPFVARGLAELWLVGPVDPIAREILERNASVFTYKGVQPRSTLSRFYSESDVLVLPSIEEGLAYVQAQAMACGVPVISSTNTGGEDLFTDGVEGFIVPIRDSFAIRHKIEWMMANPDEHHAMKEAALRRVRQIGGWGEYGSGCLELYRELLAPQSYNTVALGA